MKTLRAIWVRVPAPLPPPRHGPVPGRGRLPAAALPRSHRPHARPRRRRALRGLLPVLGRLPGRLHRPAGDRGRARGAATRRGFASTSRAASSAASARRPARRTRSSSRRTWRCASTSATTWSTRRMDLLISGPGKYHDYDFYKVAGLAIGGKDKGEAETRARRRSTCGGPECRERPVLHRRGRRRRRPPCS